MLRDIAIPLAVALVAQGATPAWSNPTSAEACRYFLSEVPIVGPAGNARHILTQASEFVSMMTDLERYETLVAEDVRVEFGQRKTDSFSKLGELSATAICVVDIIDRRVVRILIDDGPSVGQEIENATGNPRKITAPTATVAQIGLGPHAGRY